MMVGWWTKGAQFKGGGRASLCLGVFCMGAAFLWKSLIHGDRLIVDRWLGFSLRYTHYCEYT